MAWFQTIPSTKVSAEIKFQNVRKSQIKIIYFYVINTSPYKIITGDSQTHIMESGAQTIKDPYNEVWGADYKRPIQ